MKKILNIITIFLMEYQVKKGKSSIEKEKNSIVKNAYESMVFNYETTVSYLKANKNH